MEYTFRNSLREKETRLRLDPDALVVTSGDGKRTIPYEEIIEVRLNQKKTKYFLTITLLNEEVLYISNHSFGYEGKLVDQSRLYMTFVRVLHVHLYERSKAIFQTGFELNTLLLRVIIIVGLSTAVLFTIHYLSVIPESPLWLAALICIPLAVLVYSLRISQWPKTYNPAQVPMNLLPPA